MNLKNNPTIEELREIIAKCDGNTKFNHLVVDDDDEVLVESYSRYPVINLDNYKFYFTAFRPGDGKAGKKAAMDEEWLQGLLDNLNYCCSMGMKGCIDYNTL